MFLPIHPTIPDTFRVSLDFIGNGDGQSNTFMFGENLQGQNWHNPAGPADISFVLPIILGTDIGSASRKPLGLTPAANLSTARTLQALPGDNKIAPRGNSPRPSSNHQGISMYGFADGSSKQISDGIDSLVYARLITPDGQRFGQLVIGDGAY